MKQTIVMIHGFRGTHHGLTKIAEHLEGKCRIIVPDLPGFGEGEALDSYSLDSYVAWLHRFMNSHGFSSPPILLGHSFGSIITATYAAAHPQSISRLILVNPIGAPALEGPRAILTRLAIAYYWIGRVTPALFASWWLSAKPMIWVMSTTMAKTTDKQLRRWIHQQHYTYFSNFHSARSVSESFVTSVSHSVRDHAPHITTPTLLIVGDKDDITPLHKQHELHALLPVSTLAVIPDVGHLTHYETPNDVAHHTQAFIASS